jgi:hypothetical protein
LQVLDHEAMRRWPVQIVTRDVFRTAPIELRCDSCVSGRPPVTVPAFAKPEFYPCIKRWLAGHAVGRGNQTHSRALIADPSGRGGMCGAPGGKPGDKAKDEGWNQST